MMCVAPILAALMLGQPGSPVSAHIFVQLKDKKAFVTPAAPKADLEMSVEVDPEAPPGEVRLKVTVQNRSPQPLPEGQLVIDEPFTGALDIDQRFFTIVETFAGPGVPSMTSGGKRIVFDHPTDIVLHEGTLYIADCVAGIVYAYRNGLFEPHAKVQVPETIAVHEGFLYIGNQIHLLRLNLESRKLEYLAGNAASLPKSRDGTGEEVSFGMGIQDIVFVGGRAFLHEAFPDNRSRLRVATSFAENQTRVGSMQFPLPIASSGGIDRIELDGKTYIVACSDKHIALINVLTREMHLIAGSNFAGVRAWRDGLGTTAFLGNPIGVHVVGRTIFLIDSTSCTIRQMTLLDGAPPLDPSSWVISTIAGQGISGLNDDSGEKATFWRPFYIGGGDENVLYVTEGLDQRIRAIRTKKGETFPLGGRSDMVEVLEAEKEIPHPVVPKKKQYAYALPMIKASGEEGDRTTRVIKFSVKEPVLSFAIDIHAPLSTSRD